MRGKRSWEAFLASARRNIPAYAGKTGSGRKIRLFTTEHPRVCGENWPPLTPAMYTSGTSPRMRGKQQLNNSLRINWRNIPAYAGKTGHGDIRPLESTEHPRVCGENRAMVSNTWTIPGTSPRMRGKLQATRLAGANKRNIPAYAGKTIASGSKSASWPEHPHVCGENARHGSSPPIR